MAFFLYPPLGTTTVSPAPGADLASETTLLAIKSDTAAMLASNTRTSVQAPFYRDYSTSNITNAAWFSVGTLTANVDELEIFDSSGELVSFSIDGANERFTITPGGNGRIPEVIASGTTLYVRSKVLATINTGVLLINLRG